MNSTIERARAHLPANFGELSSVSVGGEDVYVFRGLRCQCGNVPGVIGATSSEGDVPFLDPINFTCAKCGVSTVIFDSHRDGYDARLNGSGSYAQGTNPQPTSCEECGNEAAILLCGLSYNIDFEAEGDRDLLAHAEDYFDGIDIIARCNSCDAERHIGAWETA